MILKTASAKAECAWTSQSKADIIHQLRATWRALDKYKQDTLKRRDEALKELAESTRGLSPDGTKAINQIRQREAA